MGVDPQTFRDVLSLFATGVTIVTTRAGAEVHGMTVNAFCAVSLTPPLVLVCLDQRSRTHRLVEAAGLYAVNILRADQVALAQRFAQPSRPDEPPFRGLPYRPGRLGLPLLAEGLAFLECRVVARYPGGDHTIFLGEVAAASPADQSPPLLYYRRQYCRLEC